jgi:hypothetical protein
MKTDESVKKQIIQPSKAANQGASVLFPPFFRHNKGYSLSTWLVHVRDVYLTPPPTSTSPHVGFLGRKAIAGVDPILSEDRVSCPSRACLVHYNNRVAGRDVTIRNVASHDRSFQEDSRFRSSAVIHPRGNITDY